MSIYRPPQIQTLPFRPNTWGSANRTPECGAKEGPNNIYGSPGHSYRTPRLRNDPRICHKSHTSEATVSNWFTYGSVI